MNSPDRPNYATTPFDPATSSGVIEALRLGVTQTLQPPRDDVPYTQRDLHEMQDRGWVTRFRQRPADKAWTWVLTRQGYKMAVDLTWVGETQ